MSHLFIFIIKSYIKIVSFIKIIITNYYKSKNSFINIMYFKILNITNLTEKYFINKRVKKYFLQRSQSQKIAFITNFDIIKTFIFFSFI